MLSPLDCRGVGDVVVTFSRTTLCVVVLVSVQECVITSPLVNQWRVKTSASEDEGSCVTGFTGRVLTGCTDTENTKRGDVYF